MNPTISADISNVKVEIHRLDGSYLAQNLAVATLVAKFCLPRLKISQSNQTFDLTH